MKVKICGLSRREDIEAANLIKPDYIGFVFAKSRRQVTKEQARALKQGLCPDIVAVGVFVDAPLEEILDLLEEGIIDMAQLHGNESEEFLRRLQRESQKPVIRAVQLGQQEEKQLQESIQRACASAADYLLFDSGKGSGVPFDWDCLKAVQRPYFLAGGLGVENIEEAASRLNPYAIDISSKAETEGLKDAKKMEDLTRLVHLIEEKEA